MGSFPVSCMSSSPFLSGVAEAEGRDVPQHYYGMASLCRVKSGGVRPGRVLFQTGVFVLFFVKHCEFDIVSFGGTLPEEP